MIIVKLLTLKLLTSCRCFTLKLFQKLKTVIALRPDQLLMWRCVEVFFFAVAVIIIIIFF